MIINAMLTIIVIILDSIQLVHNMWARISKLTVLSSILFYCLFVLRFKAPANKFSVMSGHSHNFLVITNTFEE